MCQYSGFITTFSISTSQKFKDTFPHIFFNGLQNWNWKGEVCHDLPYAYLAEERYLHEQHCAGKGCWGLGERFWLRREWKSTPYSPGQANPSPGLEKMWALKPKFETVYLCGYDCVAPSMTYPFFPAKRGEAVLRHDGRGEHLKRHKVAIYQDAWGVRKLISHILRNLRNDRMPRVPKWHSHNISRIRQPFISVFLFHCLSPPSFDSSTS